jgi:hypothetical protein
MISVSSPFYGFTATSGLELRLHSAFSFDERADKSQREAIQEVFSGHAGVFPARIAGLMGEGRWIEFVPITFEVADALAYWRAEIPGKVKAFA